MSDPRFARLKIDPRFRRPKKHQSKVVVDERFKDIFDEKKSKGKKGVSGPFSSKLGMLTNMHQAVWTNMDEQCQSHTSWTI